MLDNITKKRHVEHGRNLLERFHEATDNNPNGLESLSWRGAGDRISGQNRNHGGSPRHQ